MGTSPPVAAVVAVEQTIVAYRARLVRGVEDSAPPEVQGYVAILPTIGSLMRVFLDPDARLLVTSPVRRLLEDGDTIYVETAHSVYAVTRQRVG